MHSLIKAAFDNTHMLNNVLAFIYTVHMHTLNKITKNKRNCSFLPTLSWFPTHLWSTKNKEFDSCRCLGKARGNVCVC